MTSLSARMSTSWCIPNLPRVARFSLFSVAVSFVGNPSCLVTSAVEYLEPVASPPFVDANTALATHQGQAVPVTRLIQVDAETTEITLSADVRSDDMGHLLHSRVYINFNNNPGKQPYIRFFGGESIAPGNFDVVRSISASFDPRELPSDGCYQVSLVITHEFDSHHQFMPTDQEDTAIVVWWMVRGDPSTMRLDQCPGLVPSSSQVSTSDGGT